MEHTRNPYEFVIPFFISYSLNKQFRYAWGLIFYLWQIFYIGYVLFQDEPQFLQ